MQSVKIACAQCSRHMECPNKTRMFVNYCGGTPKKMNDSIRNAMIECRLRKGMLFKRAFALSSSASPVFSATAA
jgi:hypothetical protein